MGITNHGIHLQNQTVLGFELIKPAAITQEILQKSGFIYGRKYNQTDYYDLIPAWKDHREQIWDFKLNKHHIKYIRFLHEAQNLFFDLSSTELEVNI